MSPQSEEKLRSRRLPDYRRYWLSLLRRDVDAARAILLQSLEKLRPTQVYLRLITPALNLSGSQLYLKKITDRDEQFITWHTARFMRQYIRPRLKSTRADGPVAIATGIGQDSNRVGLHMVCDLLRTDDWQIHFLPTHERGVLSRTLAAHPSAVALLLSIGSAEYLPEAARLIAHARRSGFKGLVCIGGRGVVYRPDALACTGADITALNGLELLQRMRAIRRN